MHIFVSAGEPSGDQHAGHLIEELRRRCPDLEVSGFGGPHVERAGCRLLYRLTDLAVMFIFAVLPLLWKFFRLVKQAQRHFRDNRPDAVVLIDFPGFNWHIARKAKAAGIPVFYFLPPQLWAWAPWRVRKMRKYVDVVLCGLPFEPEWYAERGVDAQYVGHPFYDEVAGCELDAAFCESISGGRVLGILPGSRDKEIERNWPVMLDVLSRVHEQLPDVKLVVASYKPSQRDRCVELLGQSGRKLPLEFHVGRTPEIIEAADCCLMVSGSVSLELLARTTPACVMYGITPIANFFKKRFLNIDYITLPNLFGGQESGVRGQESGVRGQAQLTTHHSPLTTSTHHSLLTPPLYPEWVFPGAPEQVRAEIAGTLCEWLSDETARAAKVAEIAALRDAVVTTGAIARTADAILQRLGVDAEARRRAA